MMKCRMKKVCLLLFCFTLLSFPLNEACASDEISNQIKIQIEGMVCEACSADLTKVFKASDSVSDISVDLPTQTLTVSTIDASKVSDELIKKLVTENGFKLVGIKRHD